MLGVYAAQIDGSHLSSTSTAALLCTAEMDLESQGLAMACISIRKRLPRYDLCNLWSSQDSLGPSPAHQ